MRERGAGQAGFTMIEVLIAMVIVVVGALATIAAFSATERQSFVAERNAVRLAVAQAELERMRALSYSQLALTAAPANQPAGSTDGNPLNPNFYVGVSGTTPFLEIKLDFNSSSSSNIVESCPNGREELAVDSVNGTVVHSSTFDVGGVTGTVFRYVTYRPEAAAVSLAGVDVLRPAKDASKRMTVAVRLDQTGNGVGPLKPVWLGSVRTNPTTPVPLGGPLVCL